MDPLDLPEDLIPIALRELGETPVLRRQKLLEFRQRISLLPSRDKPSDTSDLNLIRFLRGRKYNVDRAVHTIVSQTRFYRDHPQWCDNLTANEFKDFAGFFQLLEQKDRGRLVVVFRSDVGIKVLTPEYVRRHPFAIIRSVLWFMNIISYNIYAQVCGGVLIQSFEGFGVWDNLTMLRACPLTQQIAGVWYVQNCVGFRFSGAYIFHQPSFVTALWYVASNLLSESIRSRCHFCGSNFELLKTDITNTDILPERYGGLVRDGDYDFLTEQVQLEDAVNLSLEAASGHVAEPIEEEDSPDPSEDSPK